MGSGSKISQYKVPSGDADGSGNASYTHDKTMRGKLHAIRLVYDSPSAATTDVTIEMVQQGAAAATLLQVNNNNTDGFYYPRDFLHSDEGEELTQDGSLKYPTEKVVFGLPKITVAGQTTGKGVTAYIYVEEY